MNRLLSPDSRDALFRAALRSDLDELPDAELLARFTAYADQPAFEALVRRHTP
jgi:hypothetical protein